MFKKLLSLFLLYFSSFSILYAKGNEELELWLKKLNRQKETIKEKKVIEINPGIPNLVGIIYLQRKFQKEEKETFANQKKQSVLSSSIKISPVPSINQGIQLQKQLSKPPNQNKNQDSLVGGRTIRLMGYCFFDRDVEIFGFEKMYAMLPCSFEGISELAQVMGELVPKPKSYTLIFKPKEVYIGHRIYKVKSGYALAGDKSSINVASEVDIHAIKKILASAGVDMGEQTAKMVEEGTKNAQTTVNVNGDVVVKKTEFDIDVIGKSALLTGIASLVKNTANFFKKETQNIPITFRIYKGTRLWLNVEVAHIQNLPGTAKRVSR